jgi:ribosomal protein S18 acetylase RimI-like enzyme
VKIRIANKDDIDAIIALEDELVRMLYVNTASHGDREQYVSSLINDLEHTLYIVAEEDSVIVGACALMFSDYPWTASECCEIIELIVAEDHRRQGIGTALVREATALAKANKASWMHVFTEPWNKEAVLFYRSLQLYEKSCIMFAKTF